MEVMRRRCCPCPLAARRCPKVVGVAEYGTSPVGLQGGTNQGRALRNGYSMHSARRQRDSAAPQMHHHTVTQQQGAFQAINDAMRVYSHVSVHSMIKNHIKKSGK